MIGTTICFNTCGVFFLFNTCKFLAHRNVAFNIQLELDLKLSEVKLRIMRSLLKQYHVTLLLKERY